MELDRAKQILSDYKELFAKYPDIIAKKNCANSYSLGWFPIVKEAFEYIHGKGEILQVKEKFGLLQIYVDLMYDRDNYADHLKELYKITSKSEKVCIVLCGDPATHRTDGWITYRCDEHKKWRYPDGMEWQEIRLL